MRVGVPTEIKNNEFRVAITPAGVHELTTRGHDVFVEAGAGAGSSIPDEDFLASGAKVLATADDVWAEGDLVLKVKEPIAEEHPRMRREQVLFTYLHLAASAELTDAMLAIPFLIVAIALAAFLGPSLGNAMIAIGIATLPIFVRLARGTVLAIKTEDFLEAARALGEAEVGDQRPRLRLLEEVHALQRLPEGLGRGLGHDVLAAASASSAYLPSVRWASAAGQRPSSTIRKIASSTRAKCVSWPPSSAAGTTTSYAFGPAGATARPCSSPCHPLTVSRSAWVTSAAAARGSTNTLRR